MRGISANIGAHSLFQAVGELEGVLQTDKKEKLQMPLEVFRHELSRLMTSLTRLNLESTAAPSSAGETPAMAPDRIFREMQTLLAESNSRALYYLPELKKALAGRRFADELDLLDRTLYKLDFKKAAAILARMSAALNISPEG